MDDKQFIIVFDISARVWFARIPIPYKRQRVNTDGSPVCVMGFGVLAANAATI
jgi:hypothetical protein